MSKVLVDLHTHLFEKNISPAKWWKAVMEKKLSAIAITEHVEFNPKKAYEKLLEKKPKNILLIPGFEAKTTAGHLLVFGEDITIYDNKKLLEINVPIEEALEEIKKNKLTASFAHPYGYKTDSCTELIGKDKSLKLIKKYNLGTEYYNGMLGSANNFVFGSQWIKKLYNFFDFASKNKIAKKMNLEKKSLKIKNMLKEISLETFERVRQGIEFSKASSFVTVGSDAHYPRVIGTAVLELKNKPKSNKEFLQMLKNKQILWAGPNIYCKEPVNSIKKKELLEGLKYVTKKKLRKKVKYRKNKNNKFIKKIERMKK